MKVVSFVDYVIRKKLEECETEEEKIVERIMLKLRYSQLSEMNENKELYSAEQLQDYFKKVEKRKKYIKTRKIRR